MPNIVTVTLNPTVDLSTSVDRCVPGQKLRCEAPVADPGGGGVNVSRAIRILGGDSTTFLAAGGHMGAMLRGLLQSEGIEPVTFAIGGETRQSLAVSDRESGEQYRFVLPGPEWDSALDMRLLDEIGELCGNDAYIVYSGSQPPGLSDDFPVRLAERVDKAGGRLVVDISGPALHRLVGARAAQPEIVRMNAVEAENLACRELPSAHEAARFAAELVSRDVARHVVIARGGEGSVLADRQRKLVCHAPEVPIESKVGAGDSFVAAMVLSLARGEDVATALKRATAAACAAVMTPATKLCERADAERLFDACRVEQL